MADDTPIHFGNLVNVAKEFGHPGLPPPRRSAVETFGTDTLARIAESDPVENLTTLGETEEDRLYKKFRIIRSACFHSMVPPKYLVEKLIAEAAVGLLYGPWGGFKTFIVIEILAGIASGKPVLEKYIVNQVGPVVLAASEQPNAAAKVRIPAWCQKHGVKVADIPFHLMTNVPLVQHEQEVITFVKSIQREKIQPLVVGLDTLTRALGGLDVNSPQAAGQIIAAADYIRDKLGCTVLMVGHTGKDKARGLLGSNLIPASCDLVFAIDRPLATGPAVMLKNEKLKEDDPNPDLFLRGDKFAGSIIMTPIKEDEYKRLTAKTGPDADARIISEIENVLRAAGYVGSNTISFKELLNLVLSERGELENDAKQDDKARERLRSQIRAIRNKGNETLLALGRKGPGKTAGLQWSAVAQTPEDDDAGYLGSLE